MMTVAILNIDIPTGMLMNMIKIIGHIDAKQKQSQQSFNMEQVNM